MSDIQNFERERESTSTGVAQTAQDKAAEGAALVGEKVTDVAHTAKEQASDVVGEATAQAKDLVGELRSQLQDQARTQTQRLAENVRKVAGELREMGENGGSDSTAAGLVRQTADGATRSPTIWRSVVRTVCSAISRASPGVAPGSSSPEPRWPGSRSPGRAKASAPLRRRIPRTPAHPPRRSAETGPWPPPTQRIPLRRCTKASAAGATRTPSTPTASRSRRTSRPHRPGPPSRRPTRRRQPTRRPAGPYTRSGRAKGADRGHLLARAASQPGAEGAEPSIGDLVGEVGTDLSQLVRDEIEPAKAEIEQESAKAGKAVGMLGGAGYAGHLALLLGSLAVIFALSNVMNPAWPR